MAGDRGALQRPREFEASVVLVLHLYLLALPKRIEQKKK